MEIKREENGWLLIGFAFGDDVADQLRDVVLPPGESIAVKDLPYEGLAPLLRWSSQFALAGLDLVGNKIGDTGAQALAQTTHLASLTSLDLRVNEIGDRGAQALAQTTHLASLKRLVLEFNKIGDRGAQALAEAIHLASLTRLDLGANQIGAAGAQALAEAMHLASLVSLELGANKIGDAGAQALAKATHLASLISLDLRYNEIGDAGAQALAEATHLASLVSLELGANKIGDAGAQALAQATHLASLVSLELGANKIGDAGAQALAQATHLASLTRVDLSSNAIGDAGAQALAQATHLASLTRVDLSRNAIGDSGAQALAQVTHLASLISLNLGSNKIGDAGAQALAQATHLASLTRVDLSSNAIGDSGAQALAQAMHLARLISLNLGYNKIGDAGGWALAQATHLASLTSLNLYGNKIDATRLALSDIRGLRRHFAVREVAEDQPNPLVRCMVLGAPYSGKTCIAKLLAGEVAEWGREDRTLGQKRYRCAITVPDRAHTPDLELDICDLGGQSLQFMMHGLFLRRQGLFLLVVRSLNDELGHWLDLIDASSAGESPTVIPVINATGTDCARLIEHLEKAIARYRTRFSIAQTVVLTIGPDADATASIAPLVGALRFQLQNFELKHFLQPTARMQPFVAALPQPYYRMSALITLMCDDPGFQDEHGLIRDALAARDPPEPISPEQFAALVITYLEDIGDISRFDFGSDHDVVTDPSAIAVVRDSMWLEHGLYSLLPPVPGENEVHRPQRETFLSAMAETTPIPGLFSRENLHPLWAEAGIEKHQYTDLFRILLQPELGLVLPLARAQSPRQYDYLIPAYAADLHSAGPLEIGERWRASLGTALHCRVLTTDLRAPDDRILWPRYFLSRAMVWLASATPNFGRQAQGFFEIIEPQGNSFRIRSALAKNLTIDLMMHQGRLWCFGYADDQAKRKASPDEEAADFGAFVDIVVRELETALFHAQSGQARLTVSLPCKACVNRVILDGQDPTTPLGLHDLIAPLASQSANQFLECPEINTHRSTMNVLLRQFVDRHPGPAAEARARHSDDDVARAAMKLSVLLFVAGLAKQNELTSKDSAGPSIDIKTWRNNLLLQQNWQKGTVDKFADHLCGHFGPIQVIAREAGVQSSGAGRDARAAVVAASTLAERDMAAFLAHWPNHGQATANSDWNNSNYQSLDEYQFIRNHMTSLS
jgi:Leucine-rich repeat (LRR) protein